MPVIFVKAVAALAGARATAGEAFVVTPMCPALSRSLAGPLATFALAEVLRALALSEPFTTEAVTFTEALTGAAIIEALAAATFTLTEPRGPARAALLLPRARLAPAAARLARAIVASSHDRPCTFIRHRAPGAASPSTPAAS